VAWGTFAFGAVYPWAYIPLGALCAIVGVTGLATGRQPPAARGLFAGLGAIFALGLAQLVPLPQSAIAMLSPGTDRVLQAYDLTYALAVHPGPEAGAPKTTVRHALSISPANTMRALGLLSAFMLFLAGLLRSLSRDRALGLGRGIVLIGALLALIGIVQKALLGDHAFAGMKIYGIWEPTDLLSTPFGPYVNKNHFAGWMLMVIPVALGLAAGAVERSAVAMGRGLRRRVLWLSEPDGGHAMTLVFAALLMSVSLISTRSRSGLACLFVIMMVASLVSVRRLGSTRHGLLLAAALGLFLVIALAWAGGETAFARLTTESESVQLRLKIWRVGMAVAHDFPLLGTGLNTFGLSTIFYQPPGEALHYNEAHNDYLQLLTEGGGLLLTLTACTALSLGGGILNRFRDSEHDPDTYWLRVGATIGLIAIALQSSVEFSLQMPGNAAMFTVLIALALHAPGRRS
jgi:hypothetical protein